MKRLTWKTLAKNKSPCQPLAYERVTTLRPPREEARRSASLRRLLARGKSQHAAESEVRKRRWAEGRGTATQPRFASRSSQSAGVRPRPGRTRRAPHERRGLPPRRRGLP